ncbi:AarF/ABC1/UbiB kinase family protein [Halobacillus sp. A5]|uniref:ABC1 kinase family protein n=1 Tax=Halobacillus sp. A5 TaxID=2880263 RepID=UPI0020A6CF1B|nr:AarF/UbiB family protein [Halobacillus sp. A5]MCP3027512.1 AarF/ABC1/UbiB kinase family protein [Halobacillus sp. A5]
MHDRFKYISIYRISVIVWMSIKFLLQIFWFKHTNRIWDKETKQKWERMLMKQAEEYRRNAIRLGGLLIKFGQFLSSRGDLLPQSFIRELEGLVDRVEPVPFKFSRQTIEEDWGGPIEEHFRHIDENPVASASIGEVFKAELHDGTPVAVKVQRYRVRDIFQMDFKALRIVFFILSTFTKYGKKADLPALYREVVAVITNELDFTMELSNGSHFKKRFKDFKDVYIPDYYSDLSTRRVLVMEWIEGAKITDLAFIHRHQINREHIAKVLFDLCVEQFLFAGMFHSDPHPGNLMLKPDGTVVVIDFGMVGEVKQRDANSIRMMVQGFILDDYDRVIDALWEMDFLLSNADTEKVKKMIKQTTDMYLDGEIDKLDAHLMNDILEDLQDFIKEQPIQLPADYAFLGRATSIIVGVLTSVYPQVDLVEWGRPVIKKWMTGESSSFSLYKDIAKDTAKPLMSLPRALIEYLEDGDKEREWKTENHQQRLFHQFYLFYSWISFLLLIGGTGGLLYIINTGGSQFLVLAWIAVSLGFLGLFVTGIKHFRMIKNIRQ